MNCFEIIEELEKIRQIMIDLYKDLTEEKLIEFDENPVMKNNFEELIKFYEEKIKKMIFILLCNGYYTNSVIEDEVWSEII